MPTRPTHAPRGFAMLAALFLCGVVTVLSLAMLAASSAQVRAVDNAARAARAESLADSGTGLAMYYLLHPEKSPVLLVQASLVDTLYYPGEMNVPLGSDGGTADLYVTMVRPNVYRIVSTGRDGGGEILRRKICEVAVAVDPKPQHAGAFGGKLVLDNRWTVAGTGGLRAMRILSGDLGLASLEGPVYALNGASVPGALPPPTFPRDAAVPLSETLYAARTSTNAAFTYSYGGKTCTAQALPTRPSGTLMGDAATNPANVWYADADVEVTSPLNVNGTLILRDGRSLTLKANATVTPMPGMPALIVDKTLKFDSANVTLVARGYTYVGEKVDFRDMDNSTLDVRGALAVGFESSNTDVLTSPASSTSIKLTYDPSVLDLPDFTLPRDAVPTAVEIVGWNLKP